MILRAFVVMPFGKEVNISPASHSLGSLSQTVDFEKVYESLVAPALKKVGCQPFRADKEVSAGDIRTDMFFELVTADLVVADLSILNPNVYYELGIRDGICPRGTFIIDGNWSPQRPFDVAPDRSFRYDGKLFLNTNNNGTHASGCDHPEVTKAVEGLAATFARALASEVQTTDSPVYSHLPGLKPPNWEDIDTSRARYFGSLQSDWQKRVQEAQRRDLPGHILTIATDAPTRVHRCKILWDAARALIGLWHFDAAEEVLKDILQLSPDDLQAQLYLGIVYAMNGQAQQPEEWIQSISKKNEDDPQVQLTMGFIHRLAWYLKWKNPENKDDPGQRERAKDAIDLLLSAARFFFQAQQGHPELFLGGYNALLLLAIAENLSHKIDFPPLIFDRKELATVVRYAANSAKLKTDPAGDDETRFWSEVALAGLELINGNKTKTLQAVEQACSVPSATRFNLQLLKERTDVLQRLRFNLKIIDPTMVIVEKALEKLGSPRQWRRVCVYFGYSCQKSFKDEDRFSQENIPDMQYQLDRILKDWEIGEGDLAICAGTTGDEILFAESCLRLHAQVRLLILEPTAEARAAMLADADELTERGAALTDDPHVDVWYHREELGAPADNMGLRGRHNWWMFNTARMEAENATLTATSKARLYGLILSDGISDTVNPEDPRFFISRIEESNRHHGRVKEISLAQLGKSAHAGK